MFFGITQAHDYSLYELRRKDLLTLVKEMNPNVTQGMIVFAAGFEQEKIAFRQESSFYYLTGITDPGVILTIDWQGKTTLYVPEFSGNRAAWLVSLIPLVQENAQKLKIDTITALGKAQPGYSLDSYAHRSAYDALIERLTGHVDAGGSVLSL